MTIGNAISVGELVITTSIQTRYRLARFIVRSQFNMKLYIDTEEYYPVYELKESTFGRTLRDLLKMHNPSSRVVDVSEADWVDYSRVIREWGWWQERLMNMDLVNME